MALAANVLYQMDKPETAISELTRVVKDNGILILPTYVKGNYFQRLMLKTLKLFIFESNEWSKNEYLCFLKIMTCTSIMMCLMQASRYVWPLSKIPNNFSTIDFFKIT